MRDWHHEGCQDRGIQVLRGEILNGKAGGEDVAIKSSEMVQAYKAGLSRPAGRAEFDGDDMTLRHKNRDQEFESRAGV